MEGMLTIYSYSVASDDNNMMNPKRGSYRVQRSDLRQCCW